MGFQFLGNLAQFRGGGAMDEGGHFGEVERLPGGGSDFVAQVDESVGHGRLDGDELVFLRLAVNGDLGIALEKTLPTGDELGAEKEDGEQRGETRSRVHERG